MKATFVPGYLFAAFLAGSSFLTCVLGASAQSEIMRPISSFMISFGSAEPQQRPTAKESSDQLGRDAQAILGRVNYARARELTIALQGTLRNVKRYQQLVLSTEDPGKRHQLESLMEEEIAKGVDQTIALLGFLQEYGFDKIVLEHKEQLIRGFSRDSIPPYEKELFLNSKFSEKEFDEFVVFFASHGHEVLTKMQEKGGLRSVQNQLEKHAATDKGKRYRKVGAYIKIFGGAVAAGGNVLIGILVGTAIPPAGAVAVVASTGAGLSYIGDGVSKLGEDGH